MKFKRDKNLTVPFKLMIKHATSRKRLKTTKDVQKRLKNVIVRASSLLAYHSGVHTGWSVPFVPHNSTLPSRKSVINQKFRISLVIMSIYSAYLHRHNGNVIFRYLRLPIRPRFSNPRQLRKHQHQKTTYCCISSPKIVMTVHCSWICSTSPSHLLNETGSLVVLNASKTF